MTKLPAEYLERQPEEISRVLVLSLLDEAVTAAERLGNPRDTEALHDFRVALRRLRSSIRAYQPFLKEGIPKRVRKELRNLASSTNTARDLEVQLDWLNAQSDRLDESELKGLAWLVKRLDERDAEPPAQRFQRVTAQLARIRKTLTKNLSSWRVYLDASHERGPFRAVIGALIQNQAESLTSQLRAIRSAEDDAQAHAARIGAKRLRYLMEPISKAVPEAGSLVKQLKALQDLLGDLHDTNLLISTVGEAMEKAAVEGARRLHRQAVQPGAISTAVDESVPPAREDEQPGLLALTRLLRNRRQALFRAIDSRWHGKGLDQFLAESRELGSRLRAMPGNEPTVRRFRLTGLPERFQDERCTLIDEGWLPGKDIEDCLRRERRGGIARHYRMLRLGSETRRSRIPRRVFSSMWPLTSGRRLQKKRYQVTEGDRVWRVDDLGGSVVLAETEATPGDEALSLPDWLVPYLREELSGASATLPAASRGAKRPPAPARAPDVEPRGESYAKGVPDHGQANNGARRHGEASGPSAKTEGNA